MKNNTLKEKVKYRVGDLGYAPIHTAENCSNCKCGEITRELVEFAEEHTPEKIIKKNKQ